MKHQVAPHIYQRPDATAPQMQDYFIQLVRGQAHNLNNVLTIFQGYLSLMEMDESGDPMIAEATGHMKTGADTAEKLVQQVVECCGRVHPEPVSLAPEHFAAELRRALAKEAPAHVAVAVTMAEGAPAIVSDRKLLVDIVLHLARNGWESIPSARLGKVEVFLEPAGEGGLLLRVRDDGEGIPESLLGEVFRPFYTSKKLFKQNGLGLNQVAGILLRLGGAVDLSTEPGVGTEAWVYLPPAMPALVPSKA